MGTATIPKAKTRTKDMHADTWFDVDRAGLSLLLERRGKGAAVVELLQNCWDEDISFCTVSLEPAETRGKAHLIVEDDAPDGFEDLSHSFTLFAPSKKKGDAEKRGRFNLGEKLVLSLCDCASVISTTGAVRFLGDGGRVTLREVRRARGTVFEAVIRMTKPEIESALRLIKTLLPPVGIVTTVNGEELPIRVPVHTFLCSLETEVGEADGVLRRRSRKTMVRLFDVLPGEKASIYEMGIPVCETGDRWHVDVQQRVPLNFERDNVTPAYLRYLRGQVATHSTHLIDHDIARSAWITDAITHMAPDAVKEVIRQRFGEKAVINDLKDLEGTKMAVQQGYTVVHGGTFSRDAWDAIKGAGALLPAGQVTPSPRVDMSADGIAPIPPSEWTPMQRKVVEYVKRVSYAVMGRGVAIELINVPRSNWGACFGLNVMHLNIGTLGKAWFEHPDQQQINALVIHELAHGAVKDHLSDRFYAECCRLGARFTAVALKDPTIFVI